MNKFEHVCLGESLWLGGGGPGLRVSSGEQVSTGP